MRPLFSVPTVGNTTQCRTSYRLLYCRETLAYCYCTVIGGTMLARRRRPPADVVRRFALGLGCWRWRNQTAADSTVLRIFVRSSLTADDHAKRLSVVTSRCVLTPTLTDSPGGSTVPGAKSVFHDCPVHSAWWALRSTRSVCRWRSGTGTGRRATC